ncbi:hypothetical protein BH24ACT1_BH24ACT1_12830 [soil metagenome]
MNGVRTRPGWHAVDAAGRDLASGAVPELPGATSPAAALAGAPVIAWPLQVVADDGRRVGLAEALGSGGAAVERLLTDLRRRAPGLAATEVSARASSTPAGPVDLPLVVVPLAEGVERSAEVDETWFDEVDRRRAVPRSDLVAAGRGGELEAALHVTMLLATEALDPADDTDVEAHVASGAQLWLLAGAVTWALAGAGANPFGPWSELVAAGMWPIGPSGGRLVVSAGTRAR